MRTLAFATVAASLLLGAEARADDPAAVPAAPPLATPPPADTTTLPPPRVNDIRQEVPQIGYTASAYGASRLSIGTLGFGGVLHAGADNVPIGGVRIWGSPLDRLTIYVDAQRTVDLEKPDADHPNEANKFAPSATVQVRVLGSRQKGWALAAALSYKGASFDEFGGEVEGSVLFSVERGAFHFDTNATFGHDVDGEESDGEVKMRLGYDVTSWMRLGLDGRFRYRVTGENLLPGNRMGDGVGGPEVLFGYKWFFLALSGGPSTVGVAQGLGFTVQSALGGAYW